MKTVICFMAAAVLLASCGGDTADKAMLQKKAKDTASYTTIHWLDSLKDIGTVPAGKTAEINFRFQNTGTKPLYVIEAKPGCGCTLTDYPKQPILPGKEGIIKASYNVHKDGQGEFHKNIKVVTNTLGKTDHYIYFSGMIKADSTGKK